jgi:hypothetical protein
MELKRKNEDITTDCLKLRCERKASIRDRLKENASIIKDCWISDRSLHTGL